MIVLALARWLLLLAVLLMLGVALDRLLIRLDRRGVIRYRSGRSDGSKADNVRSAADRFRSGKVREGRAPEGFPDDPFPSLDLDEEEDEEPPDNVYPFH